MDKQDERKLLKILQSIDGTLKRIEQSIKKENIFTDTEITIGGEYIMGAVQSAVCRRNESLYEKESHEVQ